MAQPTFEFEPKAQPKGRPLSRHCSRLGAERAKPRVAAQCQRLLDHYAQYPAGLTDQEMATLLGVERSTVNARRSELVKAGLVSCCGSRVNDRTQVRNTAWTLTERQW
jgi:CRP-like cAMP-binding protein